ncbi:MYND-type domain-containing protein [Mycena kentingensis (nom. inval.)]|nr:MYND-type domain-containing protein [Mycena kentingensis (nom. inval.)]
MPEIAVLSTDARGELVVESLKMSEEEMRLTLGNFEEPRPTTPDKDACFKCKTTGVPLMCCGKCRAIFYCGKGCQKDDWKDHKDLCLKFLQKHSYRKMGKKEHKLETKGHRAHRNVDKIYGDLNTLMAFHSGYTFQPLVWFALDLFSDLSKADTHFVAMTLSRNRGVGAGGRTVYSLVDAEVLPFEILRMKPLRDADGRATMPVLVFHEEVRQLMEQNPTGMTIGGAYVVCIELSQKDKEKGKNVAKAVVETIDGFFGHTVPLCAEGREYYLRAHPKEQHSEWKKSLKNSLDGYNFEPERRPIPAAVRKILDKSASIIREGQFDSFSTEGNLDMEALKAALTS